MSAEVKPEHSALGKHFYLKLLALSGFLALFTAYAVMKMAIRGGAVTMPNLAGRSRLAAAGQLRQLGLGLKVDDRRFSSSQPNEAVISQDIQAGSRIKRGRTVHVVLSKGSSQVVAPEMTGMNLRQALIVLQQNGLEAGLVDRVYSGQPEGTVLAQNPDPGATVVHAAVVSLLVSEGPEPVLYVMPSLVGRSLDSVRAALNQMGLVLRLVNQVESSEAPAGSVLSQSLAPNAPVAPGREISLTVAKGQGESVKARFATLAYQVPADSQSERRVRFTVIDESGTQVAYQEMEKPGAKVSVPFTVHGKARYQVFLSGQMVVDAEIP